MKGPIALVCAGVLCACSGQAQTAASSAFGIPVYPGAVADARGTVTIPGAKNTSIMEGFIIRAHFADVDAFYGHELGARSRRVHVETANGSVSTFQIGRAGTRESTTVSVTQSKPGEIDLLITRVTAGSNGR